MEAAEILVLQASYSYPVQAEAIGLLLATHKGQHAECVGTLGQFSRQLLQQIGGQGFASAHGVLRVVAEQQANGLGLYKIAVAGLQHQYFHSNRELYALDQTRR